MRPLALLLLCSQQSSTLPVCHWHFDIQSSFHISSDTSSSASSVSHFAFKAVHDILSLTNKKLLYGCSTTMVFISCYYISKEAPVLFLGAGFLLRAPCDYLQKQFTLLLQPQQLLTITMSMVSFLPSCLPPSSSTHTVMNFCDETLLHL